MNLKIKTQNNLVICSNTLIAKTFLLRLRGLMFRKELVGFDSMLISPCNSIHTFFMLISLDVLFLDSKNKVIKIFRNLAPWRMTWIYFRASSVLEMPAGTLKPEVKEGDILEYV